MCVWEGKVGHSRGAPSLPLCCEWASAESQSAPCLWIGDSLCPEEPWCPSGPGSVTTARWLPVALWAEPPSPGLCALRLAASPLPHFVDVVLILHSLPALTYSFPNLEPLCHSMSNSNCCFMTCIEISQEAGKVVGYSHLLFSLL